MGNESSTTTPEETTTTSVSSTTTYNTSTNSATEPTIITGTTTNINNITINATTDTGQTNEATKETTENLVASTKADVYLTQTTNSPDLSQSNLAFIIILSVSLIALLELAAIILLTRKYLALNHQNNNNETNFPNNDHKVVMNDIYEMESNEDVESGVNVVYDAVDDTETSKN